jgi:hypothetical protein
MQKERKKRAIDRRNWRERQPDLLRTDGQLPKPASIA